MNPVFDRYEPGKLVLLKYGFHQILNLKTYNDENKEF
jgi:hypothetical protein